jgi:YegS/Rv2252/BmrU family lipid kinase
LIYNPVAGTIQRNPQLLQRTIELLRSRGHTITAAPTTGPQTASIIANDLADEGADLIIAYGGDGTINEVANGIACSELPLAILPGGTANVLAVELGIGTNVLKAAAALETWEHRRIALGYLENEANPGRYFLLMMGAGLDAMVVYNINARLKAATGKVAYWIAGFSQAVRRLPEFDLAIDGSFHRCSFALASRVKNYGGDLTITRRASLLAPDFDIVLFEGPHAVLYLKYFAGVLFNRLSKMRGVTLTRASRIELQRTPDPRVYLQIDGEYAGRLPAVIRTVPSALTLLMPPAFCTRPNG